MSTARSGVRWHEQGLCKDQDPAWWFPPQGGSVRRAKEICNACPIRLECLAEAVRNREDYGVWGGSSEHERRLFRAVIAESAPGESR